MRENEKRLRGRLRGMAVVLGDSVAVPVSECMRDLDALLAEHRAEVEGLRSDVDALNRACRESQERERVARDAALEEAAASLQRVMRHVGNATSHSTLEAAVSHIRALKSKPAERCLRESEVLRAERDAARQSADDWKACAKLERDAALEEVCAGLARQADAAQRSGEVAEVGDVLNSTHDWVYALKSQPAERYLRVSEVKRVLDQKRWATEVGDTPGHEAYLQGRREACEDAADVLGVDLDAEGERCVGCGKSGTDLCASCKDEARTSQNAMAAEETRQTCTCAGQGVCEWCDEQVSP